MGFVWQYYDLVLLAVGLSLVVGAGVGALTAVSYPAAAVVFGGVAALVVGHGLFVNGPVDRPRDLAEPVEALN